MWCIFAMLFISSKSDDSSIRFIELVRSIDISHGFVDIAKKETDINNLIGSFVSDKDGFRYRFLEIVKKDIEVLKKNKINGNNLLFENIELFSSPGGVSRTNPISKDRLEKLRSAHKVIISTFGAASYFDFVATCKILVLKIVSFPGQDFSDEIDADIYRFEKLTFKNSPMLTQLYIAKCGNYRNLKNYSAMYDAAKKAKKMCAEICKDMLDPIHLGASSYEIQALCGLKNHSAVIDLFKKIPQSLLDVSERKYLSGISNIYSSVSVSYMHFDKIDLSIACQEMALSKMYEFCLNRDAPEVFEQAEKLRDILVKKGELGSMRIIEERYKLKPLPKQIGEK